MKRFDIIAGARSNFMKIAPIIEALETQRAKGCDLSFRLIHGGQQSDRIMSRVFLKSWAF